MAGDLAHMKHIMHFQGPVLSS